MALCHNSLSYLTELHISQLCMSLTDTNRKDISQTIIRIIITDQ